MRVRLNKILEPILIAILGLMVLSVCWQVTSRYVMQDPSSYTEELSRFLLIWLAMLGAAYAAGQRLHLAINLIPDRLSNATRIKLLKIQNVLILFFAGAVFCLGGGRLVYITYYLDQSSPALGLPLFWVYLILPVSGMVIILYQLADLFTINELPDDH